MKQPISKKLIIGSVAAVIAVVLIILLVSAWPLICSYILKKPIHFIGLHRYSTREDILVWYGEPDKPKEYIYPEENYYDVYETEFLGVPGEINVEYFNGTDNVFIVQFIVNSADFKSQAKYEKAVARTVRYFESVLSNWPKNDDSDEEDFCVSWTNQDRYITYAVYDSEVHDENWNESDGMIFQFNTWTEEMDQQAEEFTKDFWDLYESITENQE